MGFSHIHCDALSQIVCVEFSVSQKFGSHIDQGISWPGVEPVDGGRVYYTWELSSPDSHDLTDRGEAEDDLELLFHSVVEVIEETVDLVWDSVALGLVSDQVDQSIEVFLGEEVRDPS